MKVETGVGEEGFYKRDEPLIKMRKILSCFHEETECLRLTQRGRRRNGKEQIIWKIEVIHKEKLI